MPRKPRIQYKNAAYHIMSRGNRGEIIFADDEDRRSFIATLAEGCGRTGWEIHAFVLMDNHYHLLAITPHANLVDGMKWLQSTFTQRINARHKWRGHLFQGRYRAQNIELGHSGDYFRSAADYIHLNPARARMIGKSRRGRWASLSQYPWSSLPHYLSSSSKRPDWLRVDRVLDDHELRDDSRGRRIYVEMLEDIRLDEEGISPRDEELRKGWYLGTDAFRNRLVRKVEKAAPKPKRDSLTGGAIRQVDRREAERILSAGMKRLGLARSDLSSIPKNDLRKQALAWALRTRTTMSSQWISKHLFMGHIVNISRATRRFRDSENREVRSIGRQVQSL